MGNINWTQHPIGQGGFHTGKMFDRDGTSFTWVFDCGAKSSKKFEKYLMSWISNNHDPVDWLFISHFDYDHVSGLDTLMTRSVVRNVMVPYIDDDELVYLLLDEIARGNLSRAMIDLVADPAAFFLSRGAARVTFLNGGRPRGSGKPEVDEPPEDGGDPFGDKDERGWQTRINKPVMLLTAPVWTRGLTSAGGVGRVDDGTCAVTITRGSIGLRLKPYRAPISQASHQQLVRDTQALVGSPSTSSVGRPGLLGLAYAIAHHARTATGRAQLRALHNKHAGSSNRASLSLLSEPFGYDPSNTYWAVQAPNSHRHYHDSGAWVNTGDAELLDPADLADWQTCYSAYLQRIRVLALPHHGSDKNSDAALQAYVPQAVLAAHARSTSKKHPGPTVSLAAGPRLACVSEQANTRVTMWFNAP